MFRCSTCIWLVLAASAAAFPLSSRAQTFKDIYDFHNEPNEFLLYQGGELYGKTEFGGSKEDGIVFSVNPSTGVEKDLVELSNRFRDPYNESGLAYYGGFLYAIGFGRANSAGIIYKINMKSGHASVVANFPGNSLIESSALFPVGPMLYGITKYGGATGGGFLFSFNPATRAITVLYSFGPQDGQAGSVLTYANGVLYGISSQNEVFAFNIASGVKSSLATLDDRPSTGVIFQDGYLYGTATADTEKDPGEIYRVDPQSGQVSVLYRFQGGNDGSGPISLLTYNGGVLYGTTYMGGSANAGTAFAFDLGTKSKRTLYNFGENGSPTGYPASNLIWIAGSFYGALYTGGAFSSGLIYSITP